MKKTLAKMRSVRFKARKLLAGGARKANSEDGYNLAILIMLILLANIAIGVAMQKWSDRIQREKEEELIFRGLQYAEAIRVFQVKVGRAPMNLKELLETEPGFIRQLYPNPMREDGSWGLLMQGQRPGQGQAGQQPGQNGQNGRLGQQQQGLNQNAQGGRNGRGGQQAPGQPTQGNGANPGRPGQGGVVAVPPSNEKDVFGRSRETRTTGPIVGVYDPTDEESFRSFMNSTNYSTWHFRADMLPIPAIIGADQPAPRPNSGIFWKSFPEDLQPQQAAGGKGPGQGQELGAGSPFAGNRGAQRGNQQNRNQNGSQFGSGSSFGDRSDQQPAGQRPQPRRP